MKAQKHINQNRNLNLQPSPVRTDKSSPRSKAPKWWRVLSPEEQQVIRGMFHSVRGLKDSPSPGISHAARKWER